MGNHISNEKISDILNSGNLPLLEDIFTQYQGDQTALSEDWLNFFRFFENGGFKEHFTKHRKSSLKEMGVQNLLNIYRSHGHLASDLDPLKIKQVNRTAIDEKLSLVDEKELNTEFSILDSRFQVNKLKSVIEWFEKMYCSTIGYEHYYLINDEEKFWIQKQIESFEYNQMLSKDIRLRLFNKLARADYFEGFLAKKYQGKKRFSLEGGETFIPMLDTIVETSGSNGVDGLVIGMAHRGRLNVLVNTMLKPASLIFAEFEENFDPADLDYADVKYHLGYSNYVDTTAGKKVKLSLTFNPSHLEAVNPVVLGSVRARQTINQDTNHEKFIGILIHGDAAFMGQGVVAETLNLSNLENFTTGGCLHIVLNNQIGFTTMPLESRSTLYATDLAKGFQIPIFHVNGDDVEAVYRVTKLAIDFRKRFKKDVIIDLVCYRRLGHNETDEPAFTQPLMYKIIKKHPPPLKKYESKLLTDPDITQEDIEQIKKAVMQDLENSFQMVKQEDIRMKADTLNERWSSYSGKNNTPEEPETHLLKNQLVRVAKALTTLPKDFHLHSRLQRLIDTRSKMFKGETLIDWGFAESLALGSILESGNNIRFVGQDSIRGTFSHRHASFTDVESGDSWFPLNHISKRQGSLEIVNSPLSEFSVLGFEYGYSLAYPDSMVIWEAQFGDFVNGAQVIIDQFLSSSEKKWLRMSGLVLLLPHGYEGQGPEHSSARLERFLHLCAEDNIQVCYPTTPSQFFHLLRRQVLRQYRVPLVCMSPKSILRLPEAASTLSEITNGKFNRVISDEEPNKAKITTLVLMSGKIYYELKKVKEDRKPVHIAMGRLEQLYPFPEKQIKELFASYPNLKRCYWLQEEPDNMGAWLFLEGRLKNFLQNKVELQCVARPTSASPAAGLAKIHAKEQQDILNRVFE